MRQRRIGLLLLFATLSRHDAKSWVHRKTEMPARKGSVDFSRFNRLAGNDGDKEFLVCPAWNPAHIRLQPTPDLDRNGHGFCGSI